MRGIEAAFCAFEAVERGEYASEALRKTLDNVEKESEKTLAASLLYGALRKQLLWEYLIKKLLQVSWNGMPGDVRHAFLLGAGGLMTLQHFAPPVLVSALVSLVQKKGHPKEARVLNATLRHFSERAVPLLRELERQGDLVSLGLLQGLPRWYVRSLETQYGHAQTREIFRCCRIRPYASFRLSPGCDLKKVQEDLKKLGLYSWVSPDSPLGLRTSGTCHLSGLPSYVNGDITPQTESSFGVAAFFPGLAPEARILDMCAGRGGKTGLLAQHYPQGNIEAWELSEGKFRALNREMARLSLQDRVRCRRGDALTLEDSGGFGLILLDAPCSGTGTWQRHPEGKRRIRPADVRAMEKLQRKLLGRAAALLRPGGYLFYTTCSLLREENEESLAEAMKDHPDMVPLPLSAGSLFRYSGKPWGVYARPSSPWCDGFYAALLMKRPGASLER